MDVVNTKLKRNMLLKAWERCRSLGSYNKEDVSFAKSKSRHCASEEDKMKRKKKFQVAPEGCFTVYVGPEKQRFVIKTQFINHPLFKMLLDDAEMEYGYNSEGPILLPCEVDLFYKVLAEIDNGDEISITPGWSSLILCSPSRRPSPLMNKGYHGAYRLLSPSPSRMMLKLNRF